MCIYLSVCPFHFPVWPVTFYHFISSHYISSHAVREICIMKSKGVKNIFNISHKPQFFFSIHIYLLSCKELGHVLFCIMNRKFNWIMGQSPQHNIQQFIFMYQEGFTLFNISKFNTILLYYLYKEVFFFFRQQMKKVS